MCVKLCECAWKCVHLCVYIYVCKTVYVNVCTWVCICVCETVWVYLWLCVCICVCLHLCMCMCVHVRVCIYVCVCMFMSVCVWVYACVCMFTSVYMSACRLMSVCRGLCMWGGSNHRGQRSCLLSVSPLWSLTWGFSFLPGAHQFSWDVSQGKPKVSPVPPHLSFQHRFWGSKSDAMLTQQTLYWLDISPISTKTLYPLTGTYCPQTHTPAQPQLPTETALPLGSVCWRGPFTSWNGRVFLPTMFVGHLLLVWSLPAEEI